MARPRLTILVLTRDGARNLERVLPNLRNVADELVIGVDSLSADDSPDVARLYADRVVGFPHESYVDGNNSGVDFHDFLLPHCSGDWILRMDHDETLGPEWRDEALLGSILEDRAVTHAYVPRRWAVSNGERYLSGRHWHPDGNMRLVRNIPSLIRTVRQLHQHIVVAGEVRYLAEAYLVHWANQWTTREQRVARVLLYASHAPYSGHEFYLYEHQPYETRPLADPLPDPRFDADYPAASDCRYRVAMRVFQAPQEMFAGDMAPVLISIHNGSSRSLLPDSDLVQVRGFYTAYHWWKGPGPKTEPVLFEGDRWPLPRRIYPGECALAWTRVRAPHTPGEYYLQLDMVEEGVSWFSRHVEMPLFPVTVLPAPDEENWYPDLPEDLRKVRYGSSG